MRRWGYSTSDVNTTRPVAPSAQKVGVRGDRSICGFLASLAFD
jgi:hypothetical protein